jgi:hypothetical protein
VQTTTLLTHCVQLAYMDALHWRHLFRALVPSSYTLVATRSELPQKLTGLVLVTEASVYTAVHPTPLEHADDALALVISRKVRLL